MDRKKLIKTLLIFMLFTSSISLTGCHKRADSVVKIEEVTEEGSDDIKSDKKKSLKDNDKDDLKEDNSKKEEVKEFIYVHVCGAVKEPGVYKMKSPVRVYEALNKAGGMTPDGCGDMLNQAREVSDGEQIYIPTLEEKESGLTLLDNSGDASKSGDGKININTASREELMTLPGIGASKADGIISYRSSNGKFTSTEDIMNIEGIKDGVFNKIKDKISI